MKKTLYASIIALNLCLFTIMQDGKAKENDETERKIVLISFDGMKKTILKNMFKKINYLISNKC